MKINLSGENKAAKETFFVNMRPDNVIMSYFYAHQDINFTL